MVTGGVVEYAVQIDNKSVADSVRQAEQGLSQINPKPVKIRTEVQPPTAARAARSAQVDAPVSIDRLQQLSQVSQVLDNFANALGKVGKYFGEWSKSLQEEFAKTGDRALLTSMGIAKLGETLASVGEQVTSWLTVFATAIVGVGSAIDMVAKIFAITFASAALVVGEIAFLVLLLAALAAAFGAFGSDIKAFANFLIMQIQNFFMRVWAAIVDIFWGGLSALTGGWVEATNALEEANEWIKRNSATWESVMANTAIPERAKESSKAAQHAEQKQAESPTFSTSVFFSSAAIGRLGGLPAIAQQTAATRELTGALKQNTAALLRPPKFQSFGVGSALRGEF